MQLIGQKENLKRDMFHSELCELSGKTRNGILDCFEHVGVFAMACPGVSSTYPKPSDPNAKSWNEYFTKSVVEFVTCTLSNSELLRYQKIICKGKKFNLHEFA